MIDNFDSDIDSYVDNALICENGHLINDSMKTFPADNSDYCEECGAKAISKCPNCNNLIESITYTKAEHIKCFSRDIDYMTIPAYCKYCGNPYPWTKAKIEALEETVDLIDELNEDEKQQLKKAAKDISTNNPKTQVGVLKIKKYLGNVGETMRATVQKIFIDIASETAVKLMKQQGMI
ncbi:DUF2321 domain-containing protein [Clostridium hydrogenum]|uniref:DUF2321 domain-containing protein n=1 Tax=Clostridium hydrogenum TaxID=2855764 RepID=UPI001F2D6027|nr:DUF2321 domain-containing protein [Clostridium hydrogenum]